MKPNCVYVEEEKCILPKNISIVPIIGSGERLGTIVIARFGEAFVEEDLILAERGATVIGMEIMRLKAEEAEEKRAIKQSLNWL